MTLGGAPSSTERRQVRLYTKGTRCDVGSPVSGCCNLTSKALKSFGTLTRTGGSFDFCLPVGTRGHCRVRRAILT